MKKLLAFLFLATPTFAVTNGQVAISSGTGFYTVDISSNASGNARQNIVIADPTQVTGLAAVDPITGLVVHLASSTASIGNVNITSTNTLSVSGTVNIISTQPYTVISTGVVTQSVTGAFFQANQPVNFNNIAQPILLTSGTVNIISTQPYTVISTGVVTQAVTGTFFQTTQPILGTVNIISTQPFTVISTGVVTQAVTGTFFQTNQPVNFANISQPVLITSGTLNIISTQPFTVISTGVVTQPVSQTGSWQVAVLSTPTFQMILSTGGSVQVGNWSVAILSTPTFTLVNSTSAVVGMFSDNGVSSTTNRVATLPGVYQNGASAQIARTQGRDAALSVGTDGLLWTSNQPAIRPYSYTASTNSFSIASSTNDAMALCGNPTDTVLLYGIRASCTQTTAGIIQIGIVKRSSAYSGVWSTAPVVSEDSNYAGAISTATFFTSANLVVGNLIGYLDSYKLGCMAPGTATANDIYISPADWRMKPIILNSASQCVAINLNGATITGGTMSATFDFEEIYPNNFNP